MVKRDEIVEVLMRCGPLSVRDVCREIGEESDYKVRMTLLRLWKKEVVLRTKKPIYLNGKIHRGRAGSVCVTRALNYYAFNDGELGSEFVCFDEKMKDGRDRGIVSKASRILEYLKKNNSKAFYSTKIVKALEVKPCDIMPNVRRFEKKGLVFVRGYQSHDKRSPFRKGYVTTWIDQNKPREQAVKEAFERTSQIIVEESTSNTVLERVRIIRDHVIVAKDLLSPRYLQDVLNCSRDQTARAIKRARQLYSDIRVVKLFNIYPYYYLESFDEQHLNACIELKKNYIRKTKGRDNRLGHNWEAVCEWFIEKFTKGAEFWTQNHRDRMDSRRITLHLLKSVGGRRINAEVDSVGSNTWIVQSTSNLCVGV